MLLALVKFLMQVQIFNCQKNPWQKQYYFHFGNKRKKYLGGELTELNKNHNCKGSSGYDS